jgi:hypothetical protein
MTPVWQGALLVVFAIGDFDAWPGGDESLQAGLHKYDGGGLRGAGLARDRIRDCGRSNRQYDVRGDRDDAGTVALEAIDRRENRSVR